MRISRTTAMRIVRELKNVINQDLTFMDTTAHIIACTNESRIGDYHGASRKMLDEGLSMLTVPSDDAYEGTQKGVNTTIVIEGQVVAVVGITGEYETVEKFIRIIKQMTEILLLDEIHKEQKRSMQNIRNRYVYEWIFSNTDWVGRDFYFQGLNLGIDIAVPRRIVLASMASQSGAADRGRVEDRWEKAEPIVKEFFRASDQALWITNGYKLVMLVPETRDDAIRTMAQELQEKISEGPSVTMFFGADSTPTWSEYTHDGYLRAEKALLSNRNAQSSGIVFYHDINVEIFLHEISTGTKQEFINKIFKGCTKQEIARWCQILSVLYLCNGSISQAAERLYLHKNTLQYQLNKLKRISGYDPRALGDSSLFYIAIKMWNSMNL